MQQTFKDGQKIIWKPKMVWPNKIRLTKALTWTRPQFVTNRKRHNPLPHQGRDGSWFDVVQLPKQVYDDKCYKFIRVFKFMTPRKKVSSLIVVCDAWLRMTVLPMGTLPYWVRLRV
jgi:hypothetical protein